MSIQQAIALLLLFTFTLHSAPRQQDVKARLIEIPTGSIVSVKLAGQPPLRGKLGPITDSGFELQTIVNGAISSQIIHYSDVQSIKLQKKGMHLATKITLGVLAGIGIFAVVLISVAAAHGW